jgi:hypothetical protein
MACTDVDTALTCIHGKVPNDAPVLLAQQLRRRLSAPTEFSQGSLRHRGVRLLEPMRRVFLPLVLIVNVLVAGSRDIDSTRSTPDSIR